LKYLDGWHPWKSPRGNIYGLSYPYAISFGKARRMMRVGIAKHPDVAGKIDNAGIRISLPREMPAEQVAKEIKERLIPKVMKETFRLVKEGWLGEKERIEKW